MSDRYVDASVMVEMDSQRHVVGPRRGLLSGGGTRDKRRTLTHGLELGVRLDDIGLVEERDERLVGGLDDHELERVAVERDALECLQDRAERRPARDFIADQ